MQPDETNDLLHQELGSITWDIIDKDILSLKNEFKELIAKDTSYKVDKKIEIDFLNRGLEDDIKNDKDISKDQVFKRILFIKNQVNNLS
jgi:hypothetical protein